MRDRNPLVSIVIANYNYGRFLAQAIESVLSQSCQDFELIIIDGGSTDESVSIIERYAGGLPSGTECKALSNVGHIRYWVSEPDGGQSNAFNKGFRFAKGRFLTWLNADDILLPGALQSLETAASMYMKCRWFVGGVVLLSKDMRVMRCGRGRRFSESRLKTGSVSTWGPSSFFTPDLLAEVGGVDERFVYAMDIDLWQKFAVKANARYIPFCRYAWGFRRHEEGKTSGHLFKKSPQHDPSHPKWAQLRLETEMLHAVYKPELKSTFFRRLLSMSLWAVLAGMYDTIRFRGKPIRAMFG